MSRDSGYYAECPPENELIFQAAPSADGPPTSSVRVESVVRFQSQTINLKKSKKSTVAIVDMEIPTANLEAVNTDIVPLSIEMTPDVTFVTIPLTFVPVNSGAGFVVNGGEVSPNLSGCYNFIAIVQLEITADPANVVNTFKVFIEGDNHPNYADTNALYPVHRTGVQEFGTKALTAGENYHIAVGISSEAPVGTATACATYTKMVMQYLSCL